MFVGSGVKEGGEGGEVGKIRRDERKKTPRGRKNAHFPRFCESEDERDMSAESAADATGGKVGEGSENEP